MPFHHTKTTKRQQKWLWCSFHHSAISFLLCHLLSFFARKNIRFNRKQHYFEKALFMSFNHRGNVDDSLNTFKLFKWLFSFVEFTIEWKLIFSLIWKRVKFSWCKRYAENCLKLLKSFQKELSGLDEFNRFSKFYFQFFEFKKAFQILKAFENSFVQYFESF